jgi:uncharacterized protein with ATP-grasp and redox domains
MTPFCLLKDPNTYRALDWDLVHDPEACRAWLQLFERVFDEILHHASDTYGPDAAPRIDAARKTFAARIQELRDNPRSFTEGQLNLLALDRIRDTILRANAIPDPFREIKKRENQAAIKLYPNVVKQLDARTGRDKWLHLVECVLAGNTFDLGATATLHLGRESQNFMACIENVKPRPWFIDDFDLLFNTLSASPALPWRKAIVFVDNPGCDFVLGVMPFVRELLQGGVRVALAANELPSLNDIIATEVEQVLSELSAEDRLLASMLQDGTLTVVSTGTDVPVIDLADVSDALNETASDADLIVLEGMGRSVETNHEAQFSVDVLRIALIKNESVAHHVGGSLFDCVCGYTPR